MAHELEDVLKQLGGRGSLALLAVHVDLLFRGVDLLNRIAQAPNGKSEPAKSERADEVKQFLRDMAKVRVGDPSKAEKGIEKSAPSEESNTFDSVAGHLRALRQGSLSLSRMLTMRSVNISNFCG